MGRDYYKIVLLAIKIVPVITAVCYVLNTAAAYCGYVIEPLSNFAGMSLLSWVFMYLCTLLFKYCVYQRICLWYIFADDMINIIDYYWNIPMTTDRLLMLHNILIGLAVIIMLVVHVTNNKRPTG